MAAELPWERPDPFVIDVVVEPRHIDALGHVNNVHYLSWLQRCAWAHSTARGFSEEQMVRLDRAMVVRETHMRYLAATFEGDRLCVGDWITASDGRLRATRSFQIFRPRDERLIMQAQIDYVCMRVSDGKPTRMPPEFIAAYADDVRPPPATAT